MSAFLDFWAPNVSLSTAAVGAVVTVEKPERFLRRLFQAAVEITKKKIAEGFLCRFPQLRQFPQRGCRPRGNACGGMGNASGASCPASSGMPIAAHRRSWRGFSPQGWGKFFGLAMKLETESPGLAGPGDRIRAGNLHPFEGVN